MKVETNGVQSSHVDPKEELRIADSARRREFFHHSLESRIALEHAYYDKLHSLGLWPMTGWRHENFIKELAAFSHFPDGAKILDVGSGPGVFSIPLKDWGCSVVATDFSLSALVQGQREYGSAVHWVNSDARYLPFPNHSFDVVLASEMPLFSIVDDLKEAMELGNNLVRLVKGGGLFIFLWTSNLSGKRSETTWMSWTEKQVYDFVSALNGVKEIKMRCISGRLLKLVGGIGFSRVASIIMVFLARALGRRVKIVTIAHVSAT